MSGPVAQRTMIRSYHGSLEKATKLFQGDAARLSPLGWMPISQTYSQGSWGCGAFLIALLLCVFLIGIVVFIYLLVVKPDGTLVVTYQLREGFAVPTVALADGERACLTCGMAVLERAGVCKHCGADLSRQPL